MLQFFLKTNEKKKTVFMSFLMFTYPILIKINILIALGCTFFSLETAIKKTIEKEREKGDKNASKTFNNRST